MAIAINKVFRQSRTLGKNSQKLLAERFSRGRILSRHLNLYQDLIK